MYNINWSKTNIQNHISVILHAWNTHMLYLVLIVIDTFEVLICNTNVYKLHIFKYYMSLKLTNNKVRSLI